MQPDKQPAPTIHYRDGRPAWNVKFHRAPTAEECADVQADRGDDAPAEALARPGTATCALPWGPAWIEALAEHDPRAYGDCIGEAASDGFELAEEQARELFGDRARVYSDGRSGGWLVLHHPTVTQDEIEAARATIEDAEACEIAGREIMPDGRTREEHRQEAEGDAEDAADELRDARELLANLDTFGRYVASALADHGRAQAWALFSLFEHYAMEYAEEQAEADAAARLDRARAAFEDAATRLRDAVLAVTLHGPASPKPFGFVVDDLCPAVETFDATRAELASAKGGAA